jgi:hypothetical protein
MRPVIRRVDPRPAGSARVIAAGLTDEDIDRLIDGARSEAQSLLG